ncbi:MAG: putative quinol monooxygenase [Candidatus Thorarchaeota archaeon]
MTDSIVFIIRHRVKQGMFDDFKNHYQKSIPQTEKSKQGTIIQLAYINDDATEVDIIRIFPNAEALDQQLQGADQRTKTTYKFIEPTSIEIYGTPHNYAIEMIKKVAGSGIDVSVKSQFIGGFIRSRPS